MKLVVATLGAVLMAAAPVASHAADQKSEADLKSAEHKLEDARKRLEEAAREVAELSASQYKDRMPDYMMFMNRNPNRAMLGIGIGGPDDKETDEGVAVMSVSPGGPAAGAGLKTGDVIVELNGKSLKRDKEDSPREKLLEGMGKLSPGDDVTVRYTREGKSSIAKLKAEKLPQLARREFRIPAVPGVPPLPQLDKLEKFDLDFDGPHILSMMRAGSFGEMELVPLTPKLAQYFGTEKGLLVVRAPKDKELKLEDGDVLMDIDGRAPNDPGHAFRILGSYQPGEKLTLNVMRQKKKTAVAITVPARDERGPRVIRERIQRGGPVAPPPPNAPAPLGPPPV